MDIKALYRNTLRRAKRDETDAESARRVPQKPFSPFEFAAYFALLPLLIAAGAMPSAALFLMPVILPALYVLFRRFGACLPFSCVMFYGLFALLFNYDVLTVVYFCFLIFALAGVILSSEIKPYLACMAVAAIVAVIGVAAGFGVVRLAEGRPLGDVAANYVKAEIDDPFINYLARDYYDSIKLPEAAGEKLKPTDDGYTAACAEYFSEYAHDEFEGYAAYMCVHYGAVFGALAYFIAVILNRHTASPYDCKATENELNRSSRCMGGVLREPTPLSDMRFPRAYLWAVLLPGFVASVCLDLFGDFDALSATVMHAFVTVPPAFAFVTLAAFFCSLFKGKARVAAYCVTAVLCVAMVYVPLVLFVCSVLGLCDIILNLRFWTKFLQED